MASTAAAPSRCAECGRVLTDALVLVCNHDLCLTCAAAALRQTGANGRRVRCLLCDSVTELVEEAATALLGATESKALVTVPQHRSPVPCASHRALSPPTCAVAMSSSSPVQANYGPAAQAHLLRGPAQLKNWPGEGHSQTPQRIADGIVTREPINREPLASTDRAVGRGGNTRSGSRPISPSSQQLDVLAPVRHQQQQQRQSVALCPESGEPATYFCITCECACICAECVVHGKHRGHEVVKVTRAYEALRARAGALLDEASALEDELAAVADRIVWRRKDIERATARGRSSVRGAFARVRTRLAEREAELLQSLDSYEEEAISKLSRGTNEQDTRLQDLRGLQETLRSQVRGGDAAEALNSYVAAKSTIKTIREGFQQDELNDIGAPKEFVGLAGTARTELDMHAEGLASLEEAVGRLCERGMDGLLIMPSRDSDTRTAQSLPSRAPAAF
mmetsp:Transcript_51163/g.121600  ORF Transcript_51163/g.121600 Transcript_51163/m.121600 type:complete len:452 (+) Transcript_51163:112-1467(+)|eukprot:CAMPEP_0178436884 /NCGR_PEP_ID=MMETSP0689_2-20121128/34675_1 /TAXON_ID=160604 /ORGANISM="Amphidinium massartii, Strain CS-259" /LENGTH=451 /DNA_ID=CAMNT_0020059005 /DNA_START=21 /DNA_END=1373 /DNA_ORIENTATION=-